jgi:hypothetical protein
MDQQHTQLAQHLLEAVSRLAINKESHASSQAEVGNSSLVGGSPAHSEHHLSLCQQIWQS